MRRASVLFLIGLLWVGVSPANGAAGSPNAGAPGCRVENLSTKAAYTSKTNANPVQEAIDAAAGDTLQIVGTCVGNFVVSKDLTLRGKSLMKYPRATLDGGRSGTVLTINGATVTISGVTIRNGAFGGIRNLLGNVTLIGSTVTGNTSEPKGGGIYNAGTMSLTNSTVSSNSATAEFQATSGGGIFNAGSSSLTLTDSIVSGNSATLGGGIHNFFDGRVRLVNSTVSGNSAILGGGLYTEVGNIDLVGETNIVFNTVGGGIYNNDGTVTASDWTGVVSNNTPDNCEPPLTLGSVLCE